jgi:hypothetical protein
MPRGYDRPLYILPFDHRGSFHKLLSAMRYQFGRHIEKPPAKRAG